jgi:hypothetical protein
MIPSISRPANPYDRRDGLMSPGSMLAAPRWTASWVSKPRIDCLERSRRTPSFPLVLTQRACNSSLFESGKSSIVPSSIGAIITPQKHDPERWEAITRPASLTDAERLTDRQLKLSDPGMHSIHASSFSHNSVRDLQALVPIKLVIELMKLFNSRSASEIRSWAIAGALSIDS